MLNSIMSISNLKILVLIITLVSLAACSTAVIESSPVVTKDQQRADIFVPVVEKDVSESDVIVSSDITEAYPEPELDDFSAVEDENFQEETNPVPPEEPIQDIKPTPRGNELVATTPSTVYLASGKLQLVELFAFW